MFQALWKLLKTILRLLFVEEATKLLIQIENKTMSEVTLDINQSVVATIRPVTASGKPARLDSVPVWSVDTGEDVTLEVSPDGLTATITSISYGHAIVTVTADADLDEDEVREITGTLTVHVMEPEAETFEVAVGPVVDVPPAPVEE